MAKTDMVLLNDLCSIWTAVGDGISHLLEVDRVDRPIVRMVNAKNAAPRALAPLKSCLGGNVTGELIGLIAYRVLATALGIKAEVFESKLCCRS